MNENLPIITAEQPHVRTKKRASRRRAVSVAVLAALLIVAAAATFAVGRNTFLSGVFGAAKTDGGASETPAAKGIYDFDVSHVPEGRTAIKPVDLAGGGENAAAVAPAKKAGRVLVIATHPYEAYTGEIMTYADGDFSATGGEFTTAKVAEFLASELRRLGVDAEYIDVGVESARASYAAAAEKIREYAKENEIAAVIDVHRGALVDGDGNILRPITSDGGDTVAETALVAARGGGSYETRLGNAAYLAEKMNEKCARSAYVESRDGVMGQDESAVFVTAEIGAVGNSFAEALRGAAVFAAAYAAASEE